MKTIDTQAINTVNVVGKLLSTTFRSDKTSTGKPYESVAMVVRVTQIIEGKEETSEIPVSIFASQYTNAGKLNPLYENVQKVKALKTIQDVGFDNASMVRLSRANLQENYFISNGRFYDGWQIRGSFCSAGADNATEMATFDVEIFIIDMHDEMNRDGVPTGRLIIRGGIVQYGGRLDVVEFVVEAPDKIEYLQRNWNINDTVRALGRIRVVAKEEKRSAAASSWGEDIPQESTRTVRELVITGGSDEGAEEDFAYDAVDIKKAFNERKALIEQKQIEAKNGSGEKKSTAKATKYDWE